MGRTRQYRRPRIQQFRPWTTCLDKVLTLLSPQFFVVITFFTTPLYLEFGDRYLYVGEYCSCAVHSIYVRGSARVVRGGVQLLGVAP